MFILKSVEIKSNVSSHFATLFLELVSRSTKKLQSTSDVAILLDPTYCFEPPFWWYP